jgi:hypothetical protein
MLESENLWKVKTNWNILGLLKTSKATMDIIYICIVIELEHVQGNYQALGLLRDICLVPTTNIVYALLKQGKTYIKFRYCFKLSNYNKNECFSELCASIIDDIEEDNVSFLFLFCVIYYF